MTWGCQNATVAFVGYYFWFFVHRRSHVNDTETLNRVIGVELRN